MPSWIFRRFALSNAWRSRYPSAKRKSCSGYVSDATACGPDPRVQHASWTLTYPECAVVIGPAHSIDVDGVGQTPGGLAKYFNVDVTPIRILFVVMTVFGAGLVLYLTMWILVPQSSEPPVALQRCPRAPRGSAPPASPTLPEWRALRHRGNSVAPLPVPVR
jgi:phage shock protein PspC (stress-responsive transcriptional regulator)